MMCQVDYVHIKIYFQSLEIQNPSNNVLFLTEEEFRNLNLIYI